MKLVLSSKNYEACFTAKLHLLSSSKKKTSFTDKKLIDQERVVCRETTPFNVPTNHKYITINTKQNLCKRAK